MDQLVNSDDQESAYHQYMAMFHPEVRAWGLDEGGAADIERIKEHYHAVFFQLTGGVLVSDKVIIAGSMAAQRYHSLMYLNGTFDGVEAENKPVVIRGQTFFHIDEKGLIRERWSNHDHAYRMQQLLGEQGHIDGKVLMARLNGPGLSEEEGLMVLNKLSTSFNQPEAPDQRARDVMQLLSDDLKLMGMDMLSKNTEETVEFLKEVWRAYPDLILSFGAPLSGWSFVAMDWRATGSQRQSFRGELKTNSPVCFHGQAILRLAVTGQIEEAWIDAAGPCPD